MNMAFYEKNQEFSILKIHRESLKKCRNSKFIVGTVLIREGKNRKR